MLHEITKLAVQNPYPALSSFQMALLLRYRIGQHLSRSHKKSKNTEKKKKTITKLKTILSKKSSIQIHHKNLLIPSSKTDSNQIRNPLTTKNPNELSLRSKKFRKWWWNSMIKRLDYSKQKIYLLYIIKLKKINK